MPIGSSLQKFYTFGKPGVKKEAQSLSQEVGAENDEQSSVSAKRNSSSTPIADRRAQKDVFSLIPKFLLSPSNKPPGITIKLVSWRTFREISKKLKLRDGTEFYAGTPFSADEIVRIRSKAYTTGAYDCTAGVVMNTKKGTLFHLNPKADSMSEEYGIAKEIGKEDKEKIERILSEDSAILGEEGPLCGLVAAGRKDDKVSEAIMSFLVSVLNKSGIKHVSQIWGQGYGRSTDMISDFKNRIVYLSSSDSSGSPILSVPAALKNYKHIRLAPGDVLETSDGVFTEKDINSAIEKIH